MVLGENDQINVALVHVDHANEKDQPTNGAFAQEKQDGVGVILGLERFITIVVIVFGHKKLLLLFLVQRVLLLWMVPMFKIFCRMDTKANHLLKVMIIFGINYLIWRFLNTNIAYMLFMIDNHLKF
jgi:hypothetical protein